MINNLLKNFCLITFALIAPITLPAGGIQKNLNQNKFFNNTKEIILSSNTSLYSFPMIHSKKLLVLDMGTTLSVLHSWNVCENEIWFKRLIFKNTYNNDTKTCEVGHEHNQEIILLMQEYCQDVLTWITDMQYSTVANTDQKMDLIVSDFFSEFKAKNVSKRVNIKEKLNASEKNQFNTLINDSKNLKLLNIMSNISYKKIYRDQKGLGVFMDILFRSCEQ